MFPLFLALTGLSLVALVAGFVWTLVESGQATRRSGPDAGAEMLSGDASEESVFRGKAISVERRAEFSFAEINKMVLTGQWRRALPILLAIGGLLGLLLFGSLALWLSLENRLVGGLIVAVALYAVVRTLIGFARA